MLLSALLLAAATLTIPRTENAQNAVTITDFRQRDPHDGEPASRVTRATLRYDRQNLYVTFLCQDDPHAIRARLTRRDDIEQDDQVVVILDTFNDHRRAYVFAVNPLGVQRDGVITEGQDDDYTFDAVWSSEGHMTRDGYEASMTIPFRSLRFGGDAEQTWGIALGRIIPRLSEESYWPHITKRVEGFVPQMAQLAGLRDLSPGKNMQIAPYTAATRARFLDRENVEFRDTGEQRLGLDGKAVFRDAVTLDVAFNPDFSQVESDDPQVTVNQRFEVSVPEKRPFFLENAGFFQTPVDLLFSRRIADPQFGVRVTGKSNGYAFGVLASDDRAAGVKLPVGDPHRNTAASVGAFRVQREIGSQSTIGVFVSDRGFASADDRMFAVDGRIKLNANWALQAQAMRSGSRDLAGSRSVATGYYAELTRDGRHFDYVAHYTDFAPGFRAPLGFVKRVDIRQVDQKAKYRFRPQNSVVTKWGPQLSILGNWDHRGVMENWSAEPGFKVEMTGRTEFEILHAMAFERFASTPFRKQSTTLKIASEWLNWLTGTAEMSRGSQINFKPATGVAPFVGDTDDAAFTLSFLPTSQLRVDQTILYSRMQRAFANRVARTKINYQLTPRLSVRTILDYDSVAANPALSSLERTKLLTGDILVTYLVAPGTAAYIGYTDHRENLLLMSDPSAIARGDSTMSTSRQFFVKVSYLWRY